MDLAGQDRRGALDPADHRGVSLLDHAPAHRFDRRGGNIDHHIALGQVRSHVLDAGVIEVELLQACGGGHVQGVPGRFIDPAVDDQPVAGLEDAHGAIGIGVEHVTGELDQRHVAGGYEATLELHHRRIGLAQIELERPLRDFLPAASGDEGFILRDGELQVVQRVEGQDRLIGGDRCRSGGRIALLVGFAQHATGREHVEHRFLRPSRHCCPGAQNRH